MRSAARAYIALTVAAAGAVLWYMTPRAAADGGPWLELVAFTVLALVAELRPVTTSRHGVWTVVAAFYVAAIMVLGPAWTVWVALVASGLADIAIRKPWYKVTFNAAQYVVTVAAAGLAYSLLSPDRGPAPVADLARGPAIAAMVAVYYVVNVSQVCTVIGLSQEISPLRLVPGALKDAILMYLATAALGILVAVVYEAFPFGIVLLLLPLLMVHYALTSYTELKRETLETLALLADLIDRRDAYTYQHSRRVARTAELIAREMGLSEDDIAELSSAARIHDLGKVGISNAILHKPDTLSPEEWDAIKQHPVAGSDIAGRLKLYRRGALLVRHHHERFDGHGYPDGLSGQAIPLGARIIAVADAYDAMTSERPYRRPLSPWQAVDRLRADAGVQFDPQVVDALLRALERRPELVPGARAAAASLWPAGEPAAEPGAPGIAVQVPPAPAGVTGRAERAAPPG